jgi:hypothetical protein
MEEKKRADVNATRPTAVRRPEEKERAFRYVANFREIANVLAGINSTTAELVPGCHQLVVSTTAEPAAGCHHLVVTTTSERVPPGPQLVFGGQGST